ncbi:hypothetical protein [Mesorhizobium sp. B2-3-6]|uniref:hypothetical protein n=1 Tax=Mesorhizobium sp. B2-3-6 TaxID=2589957 RepID=UPI0011264B4E|nr:hypothetical protein [Mesorhizobium sp. B2-3-6]TPM19806.1 hypothetical protein FJ953_15510 [Mesorhizobium sp. B2-3-6]
MSTSVPTLCQADSTFDEQLPEGLVAHNEMSSRMSIGFPVSVLCREADEVDEPFIQHQLYLSNKKRWLHGFLPVMHSARKSESDHGKIRRETIRKAVCTAFSENSFQGLSVPASSDLAAVRDEPPKYLLRHRHSGLKPGLMLLPTYGGQLGPEQQPDNIFLDDLDRISAHKETGERFRFRQCRRFAVAVGLHLLQSLFSISRASQTLARDRRRHPAGMVALSVPSDMGHHSFSLVRALVKSPSVSVAGNGDSNVRFWKLGTAFQGLRIPFRGPEAPRWSHV